VVVDPQRDVSQYIADAGTHGLQIERVIETHFHADFLSGHLELAAATGATISYGEGARAEFPIEPLAEGTRLVLGEVVLEILATPGPHTRVDLGSCLRTCRCGALGGVDRRHVVHRGRRPSRSPGIGGLDSGAAGAAALPVTAGQAVDLPDATPVYPAHGAGSACGKSMSNAVVSTNGEQRAANYALVPMSEDAFVDAVTQDQSVAPLYFAFAADANRRGRAVLDDHEGLERLDWRAVDAAQRAGSMLIDGRVPEAFASGHVRGSINVSLDGRFAEYVGDVALPDQSIVVVTDAGREIEAKVRLARIGFDNVRGALVHVEAVLDAHPEIMESARRFRAGEAAKWQDEERDVQVVDVRNPGEQRGGVVPVAMSLPLPSVPNGLDELDPSRPTLVYCASGYRSSSPASLLRAQGFERVAEILGGFDAWRAAGLRIDQRDPESADVEANRS
jgi:hydroxyacylglutathione hydrolase